MALAQMLDLNDPYSLSGRVLGSNTLSQTTKDEFKRLYALEQQSIRAEGKAHYDVVTAFGTKDEKVLADAKAKHAEAAKEWERRRDDLTKFIIGLKKAYPQKKLIAEEAVKSPVIGVMNLHPGDSYRPPGTEAAAKFIENKDVYYGGRTRGRRIRRRRYTRKH